MASPGRWLGLTDLATGRYDVRRRSVMTARLGVILVIAATLDVGLSIAVHGVSVTTGLLLASPLTLAGAVLLARNGRPTAAGIVIAATMTGVALGSVALAGELSTWPVAGPVIGLALVFVLPLRWWPGVALWTVGLLLAMVWVAPDSDQATATGLEWTRDLIVISIMVLVIAVFGAASLARAEHKADLAAAEARQSAEMAERDALTGLANRRLEHTALPALLARARELDQPMTIAMIDLDGFKTVNTELGHEGGDRLLTEVSAILAAGSRHSDVLVRHGGDEFLLAMPETTMAEAVSVCERLRRTVADHGWRSPVPAGGGPTLSIGLAASRSERDWATLVRQADERMLRAKADGGDRVDADGAGRPHRPA